MQGLDAGQLRTIDQELKEAVCDALVNLATARVSGAGPSGTILYGPSPRRSIVSGQLLSRFDQGGGNDETTDIRIATMGLDFQVAANSTSRATVSPNFSVYVRVLPSWDEITSDQLDLDLDFKLQGPVQTRIDQRIAILKSQRFAAANLAQVNWRALSRDEQTSVRARRSAIQDEVRVTAYREEGIELIPEDARLTATDGDDLVQDDARNVDVSQEVDDDATEQLRLGRLLRRGRAIPLALLDPAPPPAKWRRFDLVLPAFEWNLEDDAQDLASRLARFNTNLRTVAQQQILDWLQSPEGIAEAWRPTDVMPREGVTREGWEGYLARARAVDPPAARLLPKLDDVALTIDCLPDYADNTRISVRVALDNRNSELAPRDAKSRTDAIFQTALSVRLPRTAHRALLLDRVEPSYRYRDFLEYAAMGLNCGATAVSSGEDVVLATTWTPKYIQPRVVPRSIDVPLSFRELASESTEIEPLLALSRQYQQWIDGEEHRLQPLVRVGLGSEDADRESERLAQDIAAQRAEAAFIERGIQLLASSQAAYRQLGTATANQREGLELQAAPYRAWLFTNQSFLRRYDNDPGRGWRLFQLAFVLAHVPTFASRMDEYRSYQHQLLDEDAASLLYFPTGGGKSEAFYGTLLFSMFLDRLRGKLRGVTAMVRYPLRLLTLQQGQRLLQLICHAEIVRRAQSVPGWPFEIGFWVGGTNTPNRYTGVPGSVIPRLDDTRHPDDREYAEDFPFASEADEDAAQKYRVWCASYNKVPDCPVCSRPTGLRRYESEGATAKRLGIICFQPDCDWNGAHGEVHPLPFLLTDDTIYSRAPSIVLGTVDKMALLGQSTTTIRQLLGMFGLARSVGPTGHLDSPKCSSDFLGEMAGANRLPVYPTFRNGERIFYDPFPSLIIQDEAHLMEESLGTFSGLFDTLFETALTQIDGLVGNDLLVSRVWTGKAYTRARMPKVIAATATISNPERQLNVLYQRAALRFPCPGSDIYRSFFAEPAPPPPANPARVAMAAGLPSHEAPERTSPWMRLYVSLMTNDATHTMTAVSILGAFHTNITQLWRALNDDARRAAAITSLRDAISTAHDGDWRRAAIDRALAEGRDNEIVALVDLHRIALAYVTNKKGGDQVMDALDTTVRQRHRSVGEPLNEFISRLISGGVDMREIQDVMHAAERSFEGVEYPPIDTTVRSIVATSAISHGVDVDRFNSMFFAGLPSDIAEYIQASSRVGRTHVGFVMLIPTPQSRRDRYVVETHDIFHRFLERMIAPPAVERWAENAIRRTMASIVQTWVVLKEAEKFIGEPDASKGRVEALDIVRPLGSMARHNPIAFADDISNFVLHSIGYQGRGANHRGRPLYQELYRSLVDHDVNDFANSIRTFQTPILLQEYWEDRGAAFRPPMTSLRDVDEAGLIVAGAFDAAARAGARGIDLEDLALVMRAIRTQRGAVAETDTDVPGAAA